MQATRASLARSGVKASPAPQRCFTARPVQRVQRVQRLRPVAALEVGADQGRRAAAEGEVVRRGSVCACSTGLARQACRTAFVPQIGGGSCRSVAPSAPPPARLNPTFCRCGTSAHPSCANTLWPTALSQIDWSDPDTLIGAAGAAIGVLLGIGIPAFYVSRDERDDERLEELRALNRATKEATGEYMTKEEISAIRPPHW